MEQAARIAEDNLNPAFELQTVESLDILHDVVYEGTIVRATRPAGEIDMIARIPFVGWKVSVKWLCISREKCPQNIYGSWVSLWREGL